MKCILRRYTVSCSSTTTTCEASCRHVKVACSHIAQQGAATSLEEAVDQQQCTVHTSGNYTLSQQLSAVLRESPHAPQVASYAFTFPDEDKNDTQIRIMLPLFDLMNHGNPGMAHSLDHHRICIAQARHLLWQACIILPSHVFALLRKN